MFLFFMTNLYFIIFFTAHIISLKEQIFNKNIHIFLYSISILIYIIRSCDLYLSLKDNGFYANIRWVNL